jgi:predicted MFS family arabinose efflux permease
MAMLGSLALGVGLGPVTPASSHILVRTTPAAMLSMVFSIKQTGVPLGGALAGAIVPLLVVACGWRTAALLAGASSLVLAALLLPFRGRYDRERSRPPRLTWQGALAPMKMAMAHPELRRIAMASFVYSIMQLSLTSYLVTYLIQSLRLSLIDAGLLLAAAQVSGVVGRILWGALTDRYGNPQRMLGYLGLGMTGGGLLAAGFSPAWPFAAILGVCVVFGAAALGWNGVFLAEVARIATPAHAGVATGGCLFFTFLGILVGLPVFALIVELTGSYAVGFASVATITFACATALCFTRAPR